MGHSAGLQTTLGVSLMEIMGLMLAAAPENWLPGLGSSCTSPTENGLATDVRQHWGTVPPLESIDKRNEPRTAGSGHDSFGEVRPGTPRMASGKLCAHGISDFSTASHGAKPAIRQTPESGIRDVPEVGVRPHDGLGSDIAPTVSIQAHSLVRPFASAWCGSSKRSTNLPAVGPIATPVSGTSSPLSKQQGVLSQFSRNEPPARR